MPIVHEDTRKLATVGTIEKIAPIKDADAIVLATVRGWNVVVKKNEFTVGDRVVFFEVDSALPVSDERFAFLAPRGVKKDVEGNEYHVLKTAKLRGVYSQGLVLPLEMFLTDILAGKDNGFVRGVVFEDGMNVTNEINVMKYEEPLPVGHGDAAGRFLTEYARKTDSERVQNLADVYDSITKIDWIATEKIDGTSCTVVRDRLGLIRVMSRNFEVNDGDNVYWNIVHKFSEIFDQLQNGEGFQLEIAGYGVQGNKLQLSDVRPFIFDMVRDGVMVPRDQWSELTLRYAVPVLDYVFPATVEEMIESVDGMRSVVNPKVNAEGIVFHTADGGVVPEVGNRNTFKVINNKFIMKKK